MVAIKSRLSSENRGRAKRMEVFEYSRDGKDRSGVRLVNNGYRHFNGRNGSLREWQIEIVDTTAGKLYFLA